MIIHVKNKNTLIIDDFKLKCCIGKNGLNYNKIEGDYSTPKGIFNLKKLYFRKDQVGIPTCKLNKKIRCFFKKSKSRRSDRSSIVVLESSVIFNFRGIS